MSALKITDAFRMYISNACQNYRKGWQYIQKYDLLDNAYFMKCIYDNDMDPKKCLYADIIGEGFPQSESKWKSILAVIKTLESMQEDVPHTKNSDINADTLHVTKENSSSIEILEKRVQHLENKLEQCFYVINELRDIIHTIQTQYNARPDEPDLDDSVVKMADALGVERKHSDEELSEMINSNMDDFEHMVRTGKKLYTSSSAGVTDTYTVNTASSRRDKDSDISAEPDTITSVVYDTSDPSTTKREVELREAKEAVARAKQEKGALSKEHPNNDDERKQRWIEAVRKDRIRRGLGVDIAAIQKDGFEYDDPNNSIFK